MDEFNFIRNCWNTCLELVDDRGYIVNNEYYDLNDNDLKYMISQNNIDIICSDSNKINKIYIKFLITQRVKPSLIKEVVEEIKKEINNVELDVILVLKIKPNNSIFKLLKEYNNVQIMWLKQLQFNPTKHFIVPKHIKLTSNESAEIIKKYNLTSKYQLPLLLKEDIISRYYNYKTGDIIKIIKTISCQNSNYTFYRCVR